MSYCPISKYLKLIIENSILSQNIAQYGGALNINNCESVEFNNAVFDSNTAEIGGAIYYEDR